MLMRVKWTASGHRGRRGQPVTQTVADIVNVFVTVRRRWTMAMTVTAATSAPTTAPSSSVPVRFYLLTHLY